jgi:hypothetical protein
MPASIHQWKMENEMISAAGRAPNRATPFATDRVPTAGAGRRRLWGDHLGAYHTRLASWLEQARDPARRYLPSTRRHAQLLRASGRVLAAQACFARAAATVAPPEDDVAQPPPPILGAADEAELAALIERAASHQQRTLSWLRRARNATMGAVIASQRRSMLLRGLEHIMSAEQCLRRAQREAISAELEGVLARHLAMLDETARRAEQMVHDLDAESGS